MKKYLIVNADDFGLNKAINDGIIDSFRNGCVTSTSLMTTENGFEDAIEKIRGNPSLDIGIHLNIVSGNTKNNLLLLFLKRLFDKKALREKIYREFENQIKKALNHEIKISHMDTEKHVHIFPFILEIVIALALKYGIKSIRFPFEKIDTWSGVSLRQSSKILFSYLFYKRCSELLRQSGINRPDFFYGISLSKNFSIDKLKELMNNLKPGTSELSCHPAYKMIVISSFIDSRSRDIERETLTSPELLSYIKEESIILTSFKNFSNQN